MKILTASQLKEADSLTIKNEGITSWQLMERAATICFHKVVESLNNLNGKPYDKKLEFLSVFCGVGNNGGDGLVISRKLFEQGYTVKVYVVEFSKNFSEDFTINLEKLERIGVDIQFIRAEQDIPELFKGGWIIDAILGLGLKKPVSGWMSKLFEKINKSKSKIISVDMPSGLPADPENGFNPQSASIIKANKTLTFQFPKPSFYFKTGSSYTGKIEVIDIGLDKTFTDNLVTEYKEISPDLVVEFYKQREKFTHKYNYGNLLCVAGSKGKIGAALLSVKAALESGVGLVTLHSVESAALPLHCSIPEAMFSSDKGKDCVISNPELKYDTLLLGPGLGQDIKTYKVVKNLLQIGAKKGVVLDADGLNLIASYGDKELRKKLDNCVLTPHPKEFERLFGISSVDDFGQFVVARKFAVKYNCVIVLKSAITQIFCPKGKVYFNLTGNPGLATGGSGDALAGLIASLLGQGYDTTQAAVGAVYLHGLAADIVANKVGLEAVTPTKLIEKFGNALRVALGKEKMSEYL
ncbi:MAG: NAD(P)H-hydrate dehydratase [Luteibaculaceae bacterium]